MFASAVCVVNFGSEFIKSLKTWCKSGGKKLSQGETLPGLCWCSLTRVDWQHEPDYCHHMLIQIPFSLIGAWSHIHSVHFLFLLFGV